MDERDAERLEIVPIAGGVSAGAFDLNLRLRHEPRRVLGQL